MVTARTRQVGCYFATPSPTNGVNLIQRLPSAHSCAHGVHDVSTSGLTFQDTHPPGAATSFSSTMSGACKTQSVRIFWPDFSGENFQFSAMLAVAQFVTLLHEKTGFFDWLLSSGYMHSNICARSKSQAKNTSKSIAPSASKNPALAVFCV